LKFHHQKRQLQELHLMAKNAEKPVFVAGDFNVFRGDRTKDKRIKRN
jgi:endonuclease/exonuclease/phosphatase (EEP) superfamily protein YafD